MEIIKNSSLLTVGTKQTTKAINEGSVQMVFIARDADERVIDPLLDICNENDVRIVYLDSMKELGEACGIEVGSASAGIALDEFRGKEVE